MYNAIALSEFDQHVHRFLWRDMTFDKPPDHYIMTSLCFGDKPSGAIAAIALQRTADMYETVFPRAANVVRRNSYVDDLIKFVNNREEASKVIEETENMLEGGGFQIKHWISSALLNNKVEDNCNEVNIIQSEEEKVLGMRWTPMSDAFQFKIDLKIKHKDGGDNCNSLTQRELLSILARIYDPLGPVAPYVVQGKILMRRTYSENNDEKGIWDNPIALHQEWMNFFEGLDKVENITFKRCLKPEGGSKSPELVLYSDSSEEAYGTCAYVRWQMQDGVYEVNLIMAKNRIAPKRTLNIPRLERCAAVIATRLRKKIEELMDYQFRKVYHLTDSRIVRDQIKSESHGFQTFTAVRVGEIQENSKESKWW